MRSILSSLQSVGDLDTQQSDHAVGHTRTSTAALLHLPEYDARHWTQDEGQAQHTRVASHVTNASLAETERRLWATTSNKQLSPRRRGVQWCVGLTRHRPSWFGQAEVHTPLIRRMIKAPVMAAARKHENDMDSKENRGPVGVDTTAMVIVPKRGRRRKLPIMSNSERAKYYRRKHAEQSQELDVDTKRLRQEVKYLTIRLQIHRQLLLARTSSLVVRRVLLHVRTFIEDTIHTKSHGLHSQRHQLQSVELLGDASGPIVRVRSIVKGKLTTAVIHSIYPFVLGNTVVLDEMMHKAVSYDCRYEFFFSSDGEVERESVELDTVVGLRGVLLDLKTAIRVASEVDVHVEGLVDGKGYLRRKKR